MSFQKMKPDVWVMDDLGLLFFHNGSGLLKLNKAWYFSSFNDETIAMEILASFPDFFDPTPITEGLEGYEQHKIRLLDSQLL
jgi:hypothetical protein